MNPIHAAFIQGLGYNNHNVALYILRDRYENASKQTNVLMQKFHTMPTPKHNPKDLRVFLTEYRKIKHQLSRVLDFPTI